MKPAIVIKKIGPHGAELVRLNPAAWLALNRKAEVKGKDGPKAAND